MTELANDWDPEPTEREWYSHHQTGDRGYKVIRGGEEKIKLDRPMEDLTHKFNESQWVAEADYRPMQVAQVAQIAFEADKKLCFWLGKHEKSRKEWASLSDKQRQFWLSEGPKEVQRKELYEGIFGAMRPFFR